MCSGLSRPADAADSTRAVCAVFLKRHEGEDTCMSYEEEDTCFRLIYTTRMCVSSEAPSHKVPHFDKVYFYFQGSADAAHNKRLGHLELDDGQGISTVSRELHAGALSDLLLFNFPHLTDALEVPPESFSGFRSCEIASSIYLPSCSGQSHRYHHTQHSQLA